MMEEELTVESLTKEQLLQSLAGQEVHGIPVGTAYPVPRREPVPGQELAKHRVRVSFYFDVMCNDGPIRNSSDTSDIPYDLALLKSFLEADKESLLHMLADAIVSKLALNSPESFTEAFLPQAKDIDSHDLFKAAIDALDGEFGKYWRETRDEKELVWGDTLLSLATEELFNCFNAEFVSSSYQIAQGQDA